MTYAFAVCTNDSMLIHKFITLKYYYKCNQSQYPLYILNYLRIFNKKYLKGVQ